MVIAMCGKCLKAMLGLEMEVENFKTEMLKLKSECARLALALEDAQNNILVASQISERVEPNNASPPRARSNEVENNISDRTDDYDQLQALVITLNRQKDALERKFDRLKAIHQRSIHSTNVRSDGKGDENVNISQKVTRLSAANTKAESENPTVSNPDPQPKAPSDSITHDTDKPEKSSLMGLLRRIGSPRPASKTQKRIRDQSSTPKSDKKKTCPQLTGGGESDPAAECTQQ